MPAVGLDQCRVQIARGHRQLAVARLERGRWTLVQKVGFPILRKLSAQSQQILGVQLHLRKIGLDTLAGAQSLPRERRIVDMARFPVTDPDRVCRSTEQ